jgi:hypothetical protein
VSILLTEIASENQRITVVPYSVIITLIDMYMPVSMISKQLGIRYSTLEEFTREYLIEKLKK